MEQAERTYEVAAMHLDEVRRIVTRINRTADRLGLNGITLAIEQSEGRPEYSYDDYGLRITTGRIIPTVLIRVHGTIPEANGYTFAARVEHQDEQNIVVRSPFFTGEIPEKYRTANPDCDHCSTRRRRLDTFVLLSPDGKFVQIGRSCLADYLKCSDDFLIAFARFTSELDQLANGLMEDCAFSEGRSGEGAGGTRIAVIPVRLVLAASSRAIRINGWTSRKAEREAHEAGKYDVVSTSSKALFALTPSKSTSEKVREAKLLLAPRDEDYVVADEVITWVENDLSPGNSDYLNNLYAAIRASRPTSAQFGLVCSAVVAYRRAHGQDINTGVPIPAKSGSFVGSIGEKITVNATCTGRRLVESAYGQSHLYTFVTKDGSQIKTFTKNPFEIRDGESVYVTGKVKKHEEYRGEKQTMINYAKVSSRTE